MTPWVTRLLIANVAMFALQSFLAPALLELLVFIPRLIIVRPWSIVTYMFLHGGLTHVLFNMLGLFFFGSRVEARLGERRFITLYLLSGITGALASLVFTPGAAVIGASAGVFGVMLAFAMFWPRERIYIWGILPVEARVLVLVTTALALYSGFAGRGGGVAHFAHLGGYLGAWVYLWWIGRNSAQRRFKARMNAVEPSVVKKVVTLNKDSLNLQGVHQLTRDEVDRILDKISAQGMQSLSVEELRFLSNFAPLDDRKPIPPS
jgi:membrane associated rhomboid family serine protease